MAEPFSPHRLFELDDLESEEDLEAYIRAHEETAWALSEPWALADEAFEWALDASIQMIEEQAELAITDPSRYAAQQGVSFVFRASVIYGWHRMQGKTRTASAARALRGARNLLFLLLPDPLDIPTIILVDLLFPV